MIERNTGKLFPDPIKNICNITLLPTIHISETTKCTKMITLNDSESVGSIVTSFLQKTSDFYGNVRKS